MSATLIQKGRWEHNKVGPYKSILNTLVFILGEDNVFEGFKYKNETI